MTVPANPERKSPLPSLVRKARAAAVVALAILLSGCVVVPAYGPHYYHPYRAYYW